MSHVFPRSATAQLPVIDHGDGCYLIDTNGKRYLDASGGAAVSCLGHSDESVKQAIKNQLDKIAFAHTGFFTSQTAEDLADLLVANAPENIDKVYFVSGGSEAVEAALKLARQYHIENGEPGRSRIISRWQSYHGNTLGALSAGGNRLRRKPFLPLLVEMSHISPCYAYRGQSSDESEFSYGQRVANELETEIETVGAENIAAFIAEPVVGATMGAVPAVQGYFSRIREICDQYGVLLILDEVMCGMGRTGTLFACEQDRVTPDIVCIAKGLGAGYQPIGAMLCSRKIYSAIENGSGAFQHGHTYLGHPAVCAAGKAVISRLLNDGLVTRVNTIGEEFERALVEGFARHPHIGDIRGRGLFRGLELVADRDSQQSFDASLNVHARIKQQAFENGLICYPGGGTIDGQSGDHILLAPPFIVESNQIEECIDKLSKTIDDVLQSLPV